LKPGLAHLQSADSSTQPERQRVAGLDVLRVFALLVVLVTHGMAFWLGPDSSKAAINVAVYGGLFGVDAFFVLSGFLIAQQLLKIMRFELSGMAKLRLFWRRRWLRTLPNYALFLLLNLAVYKFILLKPLGGFSYFIFSQSLYAPMPVFFFPESWSLALEEWFYLTIPLLLLALQTWPQKQKLPLLALILTAFAALRLCFVAAFDPHWDEGVRKIVLLRLDAPLYGVILALGLSARPALERGARIRLALLGVALVIASAGWCLTDTSTLWFRSLIFSVVPMGFMLTLPFFAAWHAPTPRLWHRGVTWVSDLTYSAYLSHFLIMLVMLHVGAGWIAQSPMHQLAATCAWLLVTFAVSACVFRYFESPFLRLRER
jgi:peptidoglycan/LPS O-acetylase OafA/YrhL